MNVSEIKAGDKIYFQGNQGEVMRVTSDENEPLLEVVLTQKRVAYLNPSQLDLYPFSEQLNENQHVALEVLKEEYEDRGNCAAAIYWALEYDSLPKLEKKEFAQVLQVFIQWLLEQEEHNESS